MKTEHLLIISLTSLSFFKNKNHFNIFHAYRVLRPSARNSVFSSKEFLMHFFRVQNANWFETCPQRIKYICNKYLLNEYSFTSFFYIYSCFSLKEWYSDFKKCTVTKIHFMDTSCVQTPLAISIKFFSILYGLHINDLKYRLSSNTKEKDEIHKTFHMCFVTIPLRFQGQRWCQRKFPEAFDKS